MLIEIDVRENKLINLLEEKMQHDKIPQKVELEKKQLLLGDIILNHNFQRLVIERKSINDLAASISDGRYNEQSFRLEQSSIHNHNIIYLIEGDIRKYKNTSRINQKALYSSLLSLNTYKGFSVMRTFDLEETAKLILYFCEKMIKNEKNNFYYNQVSNEVINTSEIEKTQEKTQEKCEYIDVMKQSKKSNITTDNIGEILLCQIPSVSKAISKRVLLEYKTIRNLIEAYEHDNTILNNLKIADNNGNERKVNKTAIANIISFLIENK